MIKNIKKESMSKIIGMTLMAFTILMFGCSHHQDKDVAKITVPGSGACEEVLKIIAMAFNNGHPESEVIIPKSTGTSGGIRAVSNGENILGRVGRPLKDDEMNKGLIFLPFAYDAVVFAVGRDVEIGNLSPDQLADIFMGKITNWKDLGGAEGTVRVLTRQPNETSLKKISELGPLKDIVFTDQAKCAFHDYEMVDLLNKFPTSIGFLTNSSLATPGHTIKAIGIDGTTPTQENVRSGSYPLMTTYGLIYRKGRLNDTAMKFIDFIFSEKGKGIVVDHGLVPIGRSV